MTRVICSLAVALICVFSSISHAKNVHIVAEVNGEAITNHEVTNRTKLVLSTRNLPNNPQLREQVRRFVITSLVNETIQRQYANDVGIRVTENDLAQAYHSLEEQNNIPEGEFNKHLESVGVPEESMTSQVDAQIIWQKIVARDVRPRVQITEFEVEDALDLARASIEGQQEYYISEIVLEVDGILADNTINLAKDLIQQLENGASFGELANQFSIAASKEAAGALGWIPENQIPAPFREHVIKANANSLIGPLLDDTTNTVRIVKIGNSRDISTNIAAQEARIRELLTARAVEKQSQALMKELRQKSFVEYR